jgi:hypothetical protein
MIRQADISNSLIKGEYRYGICFSDHSYSSCGVLLLQQHETGQLGF